MLPISNLMKLNSMDYYTSAWVQIWLYLKPVSNWNLVFRQCAACPYKWLSLSVRLFVRPSVCLSIYPSVCLSICLSAFRIFCVPEPYCLCVPPCLFVWFHWDRSTCTVSLLWRTALCRLAVIVSFKIRTKAKPLIAKRLKNHRGP